MGQGRGSPSPRGEAGLRAPVLSGGTQRQRLLTRSIPTAHLARIQTLAQTHVARPLWRGSGNTAGKWEHRGLDCAEGRISVSSPWTPLNCPLKESFLHSQASAVALCSLPDLRLAICSSLTFFLSFLPQPSPLAPPVSPRSFCRPAPALNIVTMSTGV